MSHIEFVVRAHKALFTTLDSHLGGEKHTSCYPTYAALKGLVESIYWKPTITWHIEKVRVMRRIQTFNENIKARRINEDSVYLPTYTYLQDVEYQVGASFSFNKHQKNMERDRDFFKHLSIAQKSVERGGRRDTFLGTRECQGYVEPAVFGSGEGAFDNTGELSLPRQYHSILYPSEVGGKLWRKALFDPKMVNGVIEFPKPMDCPVIIDLFERPMKLFPDIKHRDEV